VSASLDRLLWQKSRRDVPEIKSRPRGILQLHIEHLVEVAIVKLATVSDAEGGAAHQAIHGRGIEAVGQQIQILLPPALFAQVIREAGDWLVRNREQSVEDDAELASQNLLVIRFQFGLRSGQFRPERIIDQMQRQGGSVADVVELAERRDAFIEHAVAALAIDVFRGVAGQGSDDLDLVPSQIIREPTVLGFFDYRQIVPINDFGAGRACGFDEVTKKLAQLRRAAGEIDNGRAKPPNPVTYATGGGRVHHLRAPGRGIHVTMPAGLIALPPEIDLQRLQPRAAQGQTVVGQLLFKVIHEFTGMITGSGHCSISILTCRQEGAPVRFAIEVAQLAQDLNTQTALAD